MELLSYSHSPCSLLAPAIAILLAVITRCVIISLVAGIVVGSLLLTSFNLLDTATYLFESSIKVFWNNDGPNTSSVFILIFLGLLGIITTLIDVSGGASAFSDWARKRVKTRQGAQFLTIIIGMIIFVDDYFNALAVGNIGRPLTDHHGVSRAKLAYLIDSTATTVCVITPISSWGAYIIALISSILIDHEITDISAIGAFLTMVPMNLYAVFTLTMVFCTAVMDLNVGTMLTHERRAKAGELYDSRRGIPQGVSTTQYSSKHGRVSDLVIPILVLIIATSAALIGTGAAALQESGDAFSILGIFKNTNIFNSLIYGGLISLIITTLRMLGHNLTSSIWLNTILTGIKSMLPAIYILMFTWMLVDVINALETGKYLGFVVHSMQIDAGYLPLIMFIVSGVIAFATGASWGTFGIMLPIAGDIASAADIAMILPMLASVLAGSVFGDHCSPISDTTILSSIGASCHHIDHVTTQLPYALSIAQVSIVGYLITGLTDSVSIGFLASTLVFILIVYLFNKLSEYHSVS